MKKNNIFFVILLGLALTTVTFKISAKFSIDIDKALKKTEMSIKKNLKLAKLSLEEKVENTKKVISKKIINKKVSKSWFSFKNLLRKKISIFYLLLIAFLIGIATSFTPCIYPMIPITIGILQSQASKSLAKNFLISTSYVAGMATVYAILGYFAATTSLILGQWLVNPWVIFLLILLFLYLAFSMFGFYEIYMPRFLQRGSQIKTKGSIIYSFLFGAVSGTAASPCISPPLALLLGFVAKTGSPIVGFFTLFLFALGMGVLLIVVGTFSNTITSLPRAGAWMNEIKKFFGFLLIGVSIYFLTPLIEPIIINILYGLLLIAFACYYGILIIRKVAR